MDKIEMRRRVLELNTNEDYKQLATQMLAVSVPWFFSDKYKECAQQKYTEFKIYIAEKFRVNATEITLAGSAWFGFSLSPKKNYRDFNEDSDIEIVIISERLFDLFWDCYLKELIEGRLGGDVYTNLSKNTFKRFVDYEADNPLHIKQSFYKDFQKQINGYAKDLQVNFDFPSRIGYRIYKSCEDYKLGIIHNLRDLRRG